MTPQPFSIDTLLERAATENASDLHVTSGASPLLRIRGKLAPLEDFEAFTPEETRDLLYRILSTEQQKRLEIDRQIDFSYSVPGVARFRVNVYFQRDSLAAAFRLLQNPELDILHAMSKKERGTFWKLVVEMVLATDFSKHGFYLNALKEVLGRKKVDPETGALVLDNDLDRIRVLQNLVHCADVSNPTKPVQIATAWAERVMTEFRDQGVKERMRKLTITAMAVGTPTERSKTQVGFIGYIRPLWETWATLISPDPLGPRFLQGLEENQKLWAKVQDAAVPMEE